MTVIYGLADFVTGGPIVDLPVMKGASWSALLNRSDSLECTIDLRDEYAISLDLRSASEPKKTILLARTEEDVILAWGLVKSRRWNEDAKTMTITAIGIWDEWLGNCLVAPAAALTAPLITKDAEGYNVVNPALSTAFNNLSYGTMGKRLVQQRLAWPGAPTIFDLPPDEVATYVKSYDFADVKTIGAALTDLSNLENGPDFAFDASRASDGLSLRIAMRHGSRTRPRIGTAAGFWSLAEGSPITDLDILDSGEELAATAWMFAGRTAGSVLVSRGYNPAMIANGYPPTDIVDTSRSDVKLQDTLDSYQRELLAFASAPTRDVSFTVRADATPALGAYRPGDVVTIDVPEGHPFLVQSFRIRITSISGDEKAETVKIGCVALDA